MKKRWTQYHAPSVISSTFVDKFSVSPLPIPSSSSSSRSSRSSNSSNCNSSVKSNDRNIVQTQQESSSLDKILLSMSTFKNNSEWIKTTHKWEFITPECKEVIHCCIDEFSQDNHRVKICFDLWNFLDVDVIAFFNIDGTDMKKSLCPIVRKRQSFKATACFQDSEWRSIYIQKSQLADDPDEIDMDKLLSVGKIEINVYKFIYQGVTSDSNVNYGENSMSKLNGVKCKPNRDIGKISVTTGERIDNLNLTVQGVPDMNSRLKTFEIYYYTPEKYQELTANNKNLKENREMPNLTVDNMIGLGASTLNVTPNSSVQQTSSSLQVTTPTIQPIPQDQPKQAPKKRKANQAIELIVIDSDCEDLDISEKSSCDKSEKSEKKKSKSSDKQSQGSDKYIQHEKTAFMHEITQTVNKPLSEEDRMIMECARFSLSDVTKMTYEELQEFVGKVLGPNNRFNLRNFEMNQISGHIFVENFTELGEMGIESELLEILGQILKILKR